MRKCIALLLLLSGFVYGETSIIIGPIDWFPVTELDPNSEEFKLSRSVGVLYSGNTLCSGFTWKNKAYTARHCIEHNNRKGVLCTDSGCTRHDFIFAPRGADLAYSPTKRKPPVKRECYVLHQQDEELLISPVCEYWSVTPTRFAHTADTFYGSSGGALVDKLTNQIVGVHVSGVPDLFENRAVKLSVLKE